jgi:replicative DNA helicase
MSNVAAESLLLSCFVNYQDAFFEVADYMDESDFEHLGHKMIFMSIRSLYLEKGSDGVSKVKIIAEAKSLGFENFKSSTKDYALLDQVLSNKVSNEDANTYFVEVKRLSIIHQYENEFSEQRNYLKDTTDNLTTIIGKVEQGIFEVPNILDQGHHGIISLGGEAEKVIMELSESPGQVGLDVGLPVWQNRIGQIRNGGITFVVASAKCGKSQLGLRIALNVARKQQLPVLYCDSELSKPEQVVRLVGMMAGVPYNVLETGYWKLSPDELSAEGIPTSEIPKYTEYKKRMMNREFWERISKLPIDYMSISGLPMEDALPRMRRWVMTRVKPNREAKFPECLIVYDYIKLASFDELRGGKLGEYQVHGFNVMSLHEFCKRYNVPVLAFGQTNRELDTDFNCVAGAKRIIDNITSATLLKVKSEEEIGFDPIGNHLLRVFCARFGPATPGGHININFDKSCGDIEELGYKSINFAALKAEKLQEWKNKRHKKDDDDDDWP